MASEAGRASLDSPPLQLQAFTASMHRHKPDGPKKLCCNGGVEKEAYELRQSTTMFFHRFLVPTMVMMHFLLGLI